MRMWRRIKCWFGYHDFRGAEVWATGGRRECFACGQKQRLTLVDLGRNRIWLNVNQ